MTKAPERLAALGQSELDDADRKLLVLWRLMPSTPKAREVVLVARLQRYLRDEYGFPLDCDGIYGSLTKCALEDSAIRRELLPAELRAHIRDVERSYR
jgi:hypothetical protein